jgi:hypothetical protein
VTQYSTVQFYDSRRNPKIILSSGSTLEYYISTINYALVVVIATEPQLSAATTNNSDGAVNCVVV